ncbi:gamma-glutamyl-gamma-aminobutyrate hydrolase family protein [Agrilactobacillus yilanensis]|uniref:Gamma-glutamyl-gamma-aminobutyrate hydrolase family protein n=2 Tax=Agrilactobacillus yilanensis TaxID=2485997 RepID=A0ABW4J6V4_9LACO
MMKPRILIPADINMEAAHYINFKRADFVPRPVVDAIQRAGGLPMAIPYTLDEDDVANYMTMGDGVVFLGGFDITPSLYNETKNSHTGLTVYNRDAFELMMFKAALKMNKAIFGMCRGMQLINIGLGGDLYQDIDTQISTAYIQHAQALAGDLPAHDVQVKADSHLAAVVGQHPYVNSRHHQAVRTLGQGLKISAKAPDGIIEAIESSQGNQIVAVQWHPENLAAQQKEDQALFDDFVKRAQHSQLAAKVKDATKSSKTA